jgi:outer membrane protein insertion porin family
LALAAVAVAQPAAAQIAPCFDNEQAVAKQANLDLATLLPPSGSPPLLRCWQLVFHPTNEPILTAETYQFRVKIAPSLRSQRKWVPYDEEIVQADFWNLWRSNFLDNLWIEVIDEPYENGVMGKHVIFHMEERSRVKMVDYLDEKGGSRLKVELSKIEEKLREKAIEIRLDSFVDQATIRRVSGVIRELYAEQGYQFTEIHPNMTALAGSPKLIHLVFNITEGPKVEISEIVFDGNTAISDRTLRGQMKDNKGKGGWLGWLVGGGSYQEAKFADDAELVIEHYRNKGYPFARVGQQQIETIRDSKDGKKRYVRVRIPIDEGKKYQIGNFTITGNTVLKTEFLLNYFKVKSGDTFNWKKIKKGFQKAQEAYGSVGFMDWSPVPDIVPREQDPAKPAPENGKNGELPIVDVTLKMDEGKQYYVNRITFTGNTTTRDNVVRREMRVAEGGVFNMEGLKESVKRLNQLGYFKPLEGKEGEVDIKKTPELENRVDIKLKFEEQNRNQLAFGAGVSQFDGFFGQLSFQTANFLGRGETVGVSLQRGSNASNYQISFSEPYLFDRPITIGTDIFSREYIFPLSYTQQSTGGNLIFGLPLSNYTRLYTGYSYEQVRVKDINPAFLSEEALNASPVLRDAFLVSLGGHRTISKITPSVVFNTVNHPIFPSAGTRYTLTMDVAGVGGNTFYWQGRAEAIWYKQLSPRTSAGLRVESQYVRPYGRTDTLPIFEKFFLGGEYSVRGFDIRSIGPRDPVSNLVTGGNKSALLNAEYYINIAGPVRLVAFYDAGQVRDEGQRFSWWETVTRQVPPPAPLLSDPFAFVSLTPPGAPIPQSTTEVVGRRNAFKTSTGLELRFFMPVLNVPFRLIAAWNPQRGGVFNNNLQLQPKFTFRFAVGTTF